MNISRALACGLLATILAPMACLAQDSREPGGEFGLDVNYLFSNDVDFNGGSTLSFDDDIGLSLSFGYRFNPKLELQFLLDWNEVDYKGVLQSATVPGLNANINGDMEWFTPRVNAIYNFSEKPLTPYISGGIGWAFIDTNIPTGQVQVGCWWDPWWGQVCTPYQPTLDVDEFTYQLGAGVRWDFSSNYTMRFAYEKTWLDLSEATSTPDTDQIKVSFVYHY